MVTTPTVLVAPPPPGLPVVRFLCGVTEAMKPERWVFKTTGGLYLSRQQLPLKLAWAISIHKSQVSPLPSYLLYSWVLATRGRPLEHFALGCDLEACQKPDQPMDAKA